VTSITIVTPWLGKHELAKDYVTAVVGELRDDDMVLIIDNGGAPELPFHTLTPQRNLGFSGGSNLGLDMAPTDAVLFLNNDIRLGRHGWLQPIRAALRPGVLVGPVDYRSHSEVDGTLYPYVVGWCCAGMTDELRALGGFETKLEEPAYYSDNLLSLYARHAGMSLVEIRVALEHLEGTTAKDSPDISAVAARNRELYVKRVRHAPTATPR
jgi:GT2 family glycosyltransferase